VQLALAARAVVGISAPMVGIFPVQKRLWRVGLGLSNAAFAALGGGSLPGCAGPRGEGPACARSSRWGPGGLVLAAAVALLVGCSSGGSSSGSTGPSAAVSARPSSPATLTIVSPVNGAVIHGTSVSITVRLRGAKIVPATTTAISPVRGHLHVYVDDRIVSMNFSLSDVVRNVSGGMHILQVEFVASDHLPFDPRVIAQTEFEVDP